MGVRSLEASEPPAAQDLSGADEWRVLVTLHGAPCSYLRVPSPGHSSGPGIVEAALVRHADAPAAWEQFVRRFRDRLGVPDLEPRRRSCSVVVCTHRRPHYIEDVLRALSRLAPPADEIVVVDNDPGELDCRRQVEEAGARYVREDRRGLDNARNAGLRAASAELIAFTDDDCVPPAGWLRGLSELFDDPIVAAVTGPAFAYALDTPAQVRFEDQGGHMRGLHRRAIDWRVLTPIAATRAGAGLNIIFRRSALDSLGEVFPPELDAGTATETGGDTYALYKVLRAGYRIVYDPATYVLHQHRPDSASLHRTIRSYGLGLSAVLAKLTLEERELATPTVWYGLWWLYVDAVRRGLSGRADPVEVRIGWDYLRGGLFGAQAWWRARRRLPRTPAPRPRPPAEHAPRSAARPPAPGTGAKPSVSVIVAASSPDGEARCLEALARQEAGDGLEVIVARVRDPVAGLRNTAARGARGDLLLFLDADCVPAPTLVAGHLASHRASARERLVVGCSRPRPALPALAALYETLDRHDRLEARRTAAALTFADVSSSNLSLERRTFERLGGFDAAFERLGREGAEFGVRALQAGVEVVYEPAAEAARAVSTSARAAIETSRLEGRGDVLLEARHPVVAPSLPDPVERPALLRHPLLGLRFLAVERLEARRLGVVLDALERLRARRAWLRLFELGRSAAYARGVAEAGGRRRPAAAGRQLLRVELNSREPIPPPEVAPPLIELTLDGVPVGRVAPLGGQWHRHLADHAATALGPRLYELPLERPLPFEESPRGRDLGGTAVIFGPARRPGDTGRREALESEGVRVEIVDGEPACHWAALDGAVRKSTAEVIALPLPGAEPGPSWLASARVALDGERVAAAVGAALAPGQPPQPLVLSSRRLLRAPYEHVGRPAQYLILRRRLYERLGGFDLSAAALGPQGPVLDLLERALDAGYVIAYRDTPGLMAPNLVGREHRRAAWQRHQARGGLMLRRASTRGWSWFLFRGLLPLAADVRRGLRNGTAGTVNSLGTAAAFLCGCVIAVAKRGLPKHPGPGGPPGVAASRPPQRPGR